MGLSRLSVWRGSLLCAAGQTTRGRIKARLRRRDSAKKEGRRRCEDGGTMGERRRCPPPTRFLPRAAPLETWASCIRMPLSFSRANATPPRGDGQHRPGAVKAMGESVQEAPRSVREGLKVLAAFASPGQTASRCVRVGVKVRASWAQGWCAPGSRGRQDRPGCRSADWQSAVSRIGNPQTFRKPEQPADW